MSLRKYIYQTRKESSTFLKNNEALTLNNVIFDENSLFAGLIFINTLYMINIFIKFTQQYPLDVYQNIFKEREKLDIDQITVIF
jgi:hypothetical protein